MESPHKSKHSGRRLLNAIGYSFAGLAAAMRHETAFREEVVLAVFLIPAGLWLGGTAAEKALLAGSVILVLVAELLNSAVEAAVDRVSLEDHRLAKRAKDMGSAAVMLSMFVTVLTWGLVILG
jgi:diacylglycerol kinase (ATP)